MAEVEGPELDRNNSGVQTGKVLIKERNSGKPKSNLARISKYLHVLMFEFLTCKEIFKVCLISRALHKSSQDPGIWERYFPDPNRLQRLKDKYSKTPIKELLMDELNVVGNLTSKGRFLTYHLVGHSKMITALDIKRGILVSGGNDNAVKVWDIAKKKGVSFDSRRGHINQVT